MLSKIVLHKDQVELWSLDRGWGNQQDNFRKVYYSTVHAVLSEDTMEIMMPMEESKPILLPIDSEYELVISGLTGLYQCFARITDRYKSNNEFLLVAELTSNLRKYQRKEFYRFSCALDMHTCNLEEQEVQAIEDRESDTLQAGEPLKSCVVVDISGGGFRFMSVDKYEPDSLVFCTCHMYMGKERKEYEIIGKVLTVKEVGNRPGIYEHRVQYYNLDVETREQIIKYIFEEERKERKKDRLT